MDAIWPSLARAIPIVVFLLAITAVAELCRRAGVFDAAANLTLRLGRGRMWLLWSLFAGFCVTCTIFLSLDTTAVLLTPVALAMARRIGARPRVFALTTLWIANTGSLLLPVSNLTNLLALDHLARLGVDHLGYVRLAAAPAAAAIVVTLLLLALLHRGPLSARYVLTDPPPVDDRVLLGVATGVCVVIGPAFALGAPPWAVALAAAAVLGVSAGLRAPSHLRGLDLPWAMAAGFAALTVAVGVAHGAGLLGPLMGVAGEGSSTTDLLRLAGVSAVSANVINNLPAYLALEPAGTSPSRLMAVLIGANAGPLVTPWASLATLLWLQRCRSEGVRWSLPRLALAGLACSALTVTAATLALAL